MAELFRRVVEVRAGDLVFSDLRVTFTVERLLGGRPGRADVALYNLEPSARAGLVSAAAAGVRVSLRAGYASAGLAQILEGDLRRVRLERSGPDVLVRFTAGDGLGRLASPVPARSYAAGASIADALRRLVSDSGLDPGNALTEGVSALADRTVGRAGLALEGELRRSLDAVCGAGGLEWSVQDGALQVLPLGGARRDLAVELSPDTGLIGNPSEDEKRRLRATGLLNPDVVPGRVVLVRSPDLTGDYRVETVRYAGDTHGTAWYVEIEGRRL